MHAANAFNLPACWGLRNSSGTLHHAGGQEWAGQQSFTKGDVVGLLLDCDAGTLTVKKNGKRLGVAVSGMTGELCWAAACSGPIHGINEFGCIRISAADERGW